MATFPPTNLLPILQEVTALLKERKESVAVAETVRYQSHYMFVTGLKTAATLDIKSDKEVGCGRPCKLVTTSSARRFRILQRRSYGMMAWG